MGAPSEFNSKVADIFRNIYSNIYTEYYTIKTVKEQLNSHMTYSTIIHSSLVNPAKPKLKETQDPVDTVTMDVPLLTKILELAREDIKSDTELHNLVSKLVEMKNQGTLTMDQYDQLIHKAEPNVELEAIRKLAGI